jgi:hypothetical protein
MTRHLLDCFKKSVFVVVYLNLNTTTLDLTDVNGKKVRVKSVIEGKYN